MKRIKSLITRKVNTVFISRKLEKIPQKDLRKIKNEKLRLVLRFCRKEYKAGRYDHTKQYISGSNRMNREQLIDYLWEVIQRQQGKLC